MDVIRMGQILARRWVVAVPILLIGLLLTVLAAFMIPNQYTATGNILVTDRAGSSAAQPAVIAEALMDGAVRAKVVQAGGSTGYTVAANNNGIMTVTADAPNGGTAVRTVSAVLDQVAPTVAARANRPAGEKPPVEIVNRPADGSAVLSSPGVWRSTGSARMTNVASDRGPSKDAMTKLLASVLNSDPVRQQVVAAGGSEEYTVEVPKSVSTVTYTIKGTDAEQVKKTAKSLVDQSGPQLTNLLGMITADSNALVAVSVNEVGEPTVSRTGLFRSLIALLAVTIALGIAAAFAAEAIAEAREDKRTGGQGGRSAARPAQAPAVRPGNGTAPTAPPVGQPGQQR